MDQMAGQESEPFTIDLKRGAPESGRSEAEIIESMNQYLREAEIARIAIKETFIGPDGKKIMQVALKTPTLTEVAAADDLLKQSLQESKNVRDGNGELEETIRNRFGHLMDFSTSYRIVQIKPYFSRKEDVWKFFYWNTDTESVISQESPDGPVPQEAGAGSN